MRKLKILVVSPYIPAETGHGSWIRTHNLMKALAKTHELHLLAFSNMAQQKTGKSPLFKKTHIIKKNVRPLGEQSKLRIVAGVLSPKPYLININHSKKMAEKLGELLSRERFDIIYFNQLQMAQYRTQVEGIPCVLDQHNIETHYIYSYVKSRKNPLLKALAYFEYLKTKAFESRTCKEFNKVFVVSEADREYLQQICPEANSSVIENGVDLNYFKYQQNEKSGNNILFVGVLDKIANCEAVHFFHKQVWPKIKEKIPDASFFVVGKNPAKSIREIEGNGVKVTGFVKDVREFYQISKVAVVPLFCGGGTKIKIIEAMALGTPVVSTTKGIEGLDVSNNVNILVADSAEEFAEKTIALLKSEELRNKLGQKARAIVEADYEWKKIGQKLVKEIDTICLKEVTEND